MQAQPELQGKHILLYDGKCKVCDGLVQFILKTDSNDQFRFAAQQNEFSQTYLTEHNEDPHDLNTVYVIKNYGTENERLVDRSAAIIEVLVELGWYWKFMYLGYLLPRLVRDWLYEIESKNRYWLFGKYETCKIPRPEQMLKFLDEY